MANPVVGIDLELRLEKFKADMASIPGIATKEGKAMAAQLGKELRAVEKATKDAARASSQPQRSTRVASQRSAIAAPAPTRCSALATIARALSPS